MLFFIILGIFSYFVYKIWGLFKPLFRAIHSLFPIPYSLLHVNDWLLLFVSTTDYSLVQNTFLVKHLLRWGANPNFKPKHLCFSWGEETAFASACKLAKSDDVLCLMLYNDGGGAAHRAPGPARPTRAGVLEWRNSHGDNLLHVAARACNSVALSFLIQHKVARNVQNENGETPLMAAIRSWRHHNQLNALWLLKENGANIHSANKYGNNILHVTVEELRRHPSYPVSRAKDVIQFARDSMLDLEMRNHQGQTAAQMASFSSHPYLNEIRELLSKPLRSRHVGFEHLMGDFPTSSPPHGSLLGAPESPFSPHVAPSESPFPAPTVPPAFSKVPSAPSVDLLADAGIYPHLPVSETNDSFPASNDRSECCICLEEAPDTALVPCGHCLCGGCAGDLRVCPVCRKRVKSTLRIYR